MAVKTEPTRVQDLIAKEYDQNYSRKSATIIGVGAAGEQNWVVGQILKKSGNNYTAAVAGDTSGVHAVLLKNITLEDDATTVAPILIRGPVTVNADRLTTPATTNKAAQLAALAALNPPIVQINEPANVEVG